MRQRFRNSSELLDRQCKNVKRVDFLIAGISRW